MCAARAALQAKVGTVTAARLRSASVGARGYQTTGTNVLLDGSRDFQVASTSFVGNIAFATAAPAYSPGIFRLILDAATGKSSTGALAIHAVLVPNSDKVSF